MLVPDESAARLSGMTNSLGPYLTAQRSRLGMQPLPQR
jgi:hypothetical protein